MSLPWSPHGIVFPGKLDPTVGVGRAEVPPDPRLAPYVWSYWVMTWDLSPGEDLPVLAVPSGSFNYIIDPACPYAPMRVRVVGVRETSYPFTLAGKGWMTGVRFTPGGYAALHDGAPTELVDKAMPLSLEPAVIDELLATTSLADLTAIMDSVLLPRAPAEVPQDFALLRAFFTLIADKTEPLTVRDAAEALGVGERQLQRIFDRRVGVSPKSILRTRRFQAVADQLMSGVGIDWTQFALEMGYYDQSHLLNDFRALTGLRVSDFSKSAAAPAAMTRPAKREAFT